jgi:hypothetical protein
MDINQALAGMRVKPGRSAEGAIHTSPAQPVGRNFSEA